MSNDLVVKKENDRYESPSTLAQLEKVLEESDLSLFGSSDAMHHVITRGATEKMGELKILNKNQLQTMADSMNEIDRATTAYGRTQSSYMDYLMTVSAFTPARNARQILAEIERRRQALKENIFKQKKQIIELTEKQEEFNKLMEEYNNMESFLSKFTPEDFKVDYEDSNESETLNLDGNDGFTVTNGVNKKKIIHLKDRFDKIKYQIPKLKIEIQEMQANLADSRLYIEGALKTIYKHQKVYKQIVEKFNMDGWDEIDFEKEEARYHVTTAFAQALEDVASRGGLIDKGDLIYMRQIGIHPQVATMELNRHLSKVNELIEGDLKFGITKDHCDIMLEFLHEMADKYADSCMTLLKSKGLDNWFDEESSFRDRNKKVNMDEKIRGEGTHEDSSTWNTRDDMTEEEFIEEAMKSMD